MLSIKDRTKLSNGIEMPWFGLGVWQSEEGEEVENAVRWAIDCGYRSIDTASIYENEFGVGKAIKECGVPRDEIFITTKLWNTDVRSGDITGAFETSLKKLDCDYFDLYLIHWAVPGKFIEAWQEMENLYQQGKTRAIGVSNFLVHHLKELEQRSSVIPAINQVEFHPYLVQPELLSYCNEKGIQLEAWSPMMQGKIIGVPEIVEIGRKYNKNAAQVTLRWDLQHRIISIPKSVRRDRIISNAEIFDFELTEGEMQLIDSLDRNERIGPDPDNFDF